MRGAVILLMKIKFGIMRSQKYAGHFPVLYD
jgi:hypothetical protein